MLFGKFVTAALLALMTISVVAGIATATEIETVASTDISGLQPMARGQAAPTGFDVFAGAVGAIFWLGRQRGEDNSNWE